MVPTKNLDAELPELSSDDVMMCSPDGSLPVPRRSPQIAPEPMPTRELAPAAMTPLEETAVPPVRVRFTAPLLLNCDELPEDVDGAVLNLSVSGLACVVPADLHLGQRVWTRFHLELLDEPLVLLCEVIWSGSRGQDNAVYGLRFVSLAEDEEARLLALVRERSEGRAGPWPLPVLPSAPARASAPRRLTPWLTSASSMVGGAVLALAVVFSTGWGRSTVKANPLSPLPSVATAAPVIEASPKASTATVAPAIDSADLPSSAAVGQLQPAVTADGIELLLLTDGPVTTYKSFWLDAPRRLVVDVDGQRSGFTAHEYVIDHGLASRLRVGTHKGKVRFVIETDPSVAPDFEARPDGHALVVHLRHT